MGKKKRKKDGGSNVLGIEILLPPRLAESMMFAEDLGDCLDMIEAAIEQRAESLREVVIADVPVLSSFEETREGIFEMMTENELNAYDMLDNYVHSPKAGLPVDLDSLESRIEYADWNNEEYRMMIIELLAEFEAEIAYYAYIRQALPENDEYVGVCLTDIQDVIEEIEKEGRALEILYRLEAVDFRLETAKEELEDASVAVGDAKIEREVLFDQLETIYRDIYGDECVETIE
ncbi:hypothetical protein J6W91_03375 [Candidatus Saccharibacteria bacterium]|nr:hypothetical protein [Candidatus Saccharibacteria bacterium]